MATVALIALAGCSQRTGKNRSATSNVAAEQLKTFPTISIPAMVTTPQERAEYMAAHYWDLYPFTDTTLISKPGISEQGFADYLDILTYVDAERAQRSINDFLTRTEIDTLTRDYFLDLADRYLFDPNSPMRNEDHYIAVLQWTIDNPKIDSLEKLAPQERLRMALRNRPGQQATDFTYTLANGGRSTLYRLRADYTLLFFNNPGCTACREIKETIEANQNIMAAVREGRMKILCIYPDKDLTEWRNHRNDFPSDWINAYDATQTIQNDGLYDLKAIPTLYLLDGNKRVILKDFMNLEPLFELFMQE